MRVIPVVLGLTLAASTTAFASAHSDYTKSFPLQTLKTFAFKDQRRISRDPLANNSIWANDVRSEVRKDLTARGLVEDKSGHPDFYVAYYVGLKDRYDMNFVDYGVPVFRHGLRTGWWGWPRSYDVWAVPHTASTVIVDVIDAHTNQLVWRGHDTGTLDVNHADKTLSKAVDSVMARFSHDARKTSEKHTG